MNLIIAFLIIFFLSPMSFAQVEDVDYMSITALMLKNNYYERARSSLSKVKVEEEDVDLHKYHAFWGIILLNEQKYPEALEQLQKALTIQAENSETYLYLAEVNFQLQRYSAAIGALGKLDPELRQKLTYPLLLSKIYWAQGLKEKAYQVLVSFDSEHSTEAIKKQMWSFLVESSLYNESYQFLLNHWSEWDEPTLLAYMTTYQQSKQWDYAMLLLERMRWQWPESAPVVIELAQIYMKKNMKFAASLILEESARTLPSLAYEASALLLEMGYPRRALFVNMWVQDPNKSLKNRLAIYLELENYQLVSKLEPQLEQKGLLSDEELRYAMAYSHYKIGAFARAQNLLDQLSREDLFRKSVEIKKLIEDCKTEEWSCSETL